MLTKLKTKTMDWAAGQHKKLTREKSQKAVTMCEKCYTFYYKNSWHFEKPQEVSTSENYTVPVHFTQCPACLEQEVSLYEEMGSFA